MKVRVKCCYCGWSFIDQNIKDWHLKQCPVCKDCIIVTDKDLELYELTLVKIEKLESIGFKPLDIEKDVDGIIIRVTVDSSFLRD